MRNKYIEKLKDPRWQQKRLLIMERDSWICQSCFEEGKTLNVHHKYYVYNLDPWDYKDETLITLCDDCHEAWESNRFIITELAKSLLEQGWTPEELVKLRALLTQTCGNTALYVLGNGIKESHENFKALIG